MPSEHPSSVNRPPSVGRAALLALVVAAIYVPFLDRTRAWGWDETMHAELAAVHILLAAQDGDWTGALRNVVDCHQYPFGYPLVLALVQSVVGVSEAVCRATGRVVWVALALGAFLLVREVALRRARPERGDDLAPWMAFGLVLASPLTLAFAGTLFLEVPAAATIVFALWLWLRRQREDASVGSQVLAGFALAAAFFTKFNYGGLFVAGIVLALTVEAVLRLRAGEGRRLARDVAAVSLVPLVVSLWWFVWPWPGDAETAAVHRDAVAALLTANRELSSLGWGYRLLHWATYLCVSPRALVLVGLAVLAAWPELRGRGGRALWIVALALVLPIVGHPFYLERMLIPPGVLVFALAALGLARLVPATARGRAIALGALGVAVGIVPSVDALALAERLPRDATVLESTGAVFRASDPTAGGAPTIAAPDDPFREGAWTWSSEIVVRGAARSENDGVHKLARAEPGRLVLDAAHSELADEEPGAWVTLRPTSVLPTFAGPERTYVEGVVRGYSDLAPGRPLQTAGLLRPAHDGFLDLLAEALAPDDRLGWIGISSELSPAAIHVGLLERAVDPVAARLRFRTGALGKKGGMMIAFANQDPDWSAERLFEFAAQFDAIAFTEPIDVKARPARLAFMPRYRDLLLESGWVAEELGRVAVDVPLKEPIDVQLFLARPPESTE